MAGLQLIVLTRFQGPFSVSAERFRFQLHSDENYDINNKQKNKYIVCKTYKKKITVSEDRELCEWRRGMWWGQGRPYY